MSHRRLSTLILCGLVGWAGFAEAEGLAEGLPTSPAVAPAALFPEPIRVAHQAIEYEAAGTLYYGELVHDTYAGSWIISERADGSRLVIDLARGEMTEIRPAEGVYWTIDFGRFAELRSRLVSFEHGWQTESQPTGMQPNETPGQRSVATQAAGTQQAISRSAGPNGQTPRGGIGDLEVIEVARSATRSGGTRSSSLANETVEEHLAGEEPPFKAQGVRRLEVRKRGAAEGGPRAEIWVDPRYQFTPAARQALDRFDREVSGAKWVDPLEPTQVAAAVRDATSGALPVRSVAPVFRQGGEIIGQREDRVRKVERLPSFDPSLIRVPEGLKRQSHPLEGLVLALEAEAANDAALAGRP